MSALLEVHDLHSGYGSSQVLFGVSLSIEAGGVSTLLGRNGMGKTTTVRSILGLTPAFAGTVRFCGERVEGYSPDRIARMGLAVVPEGRQIFPTLSVQENLLAFAANRNSSATPWTLERVYALFPRLAERHRHMGNQLSGGEQQMLAIGRALMGGPRLLLLDEPSLGLSPIITDQVFEALRRLNGSGLTILLVEQNAHRALQATQRAYLLEHGELAFQGKSADLINDEKVIAHYLGHMTTA